MAINPVLADGTPRSVVRGSGITTLVNAIELLAAGHRQVEQLFGEFNAAEDATRREELANDLRRAVAVNAQVEEEIFHPAILEAAATANLDLDALGARMEQRKIQLMDDAATDRGYDEAAAREDDDETTGSDADLSAAQDDEEGSTH